MAREEIFFGINIDTGDAIKDFGTLKNRTKALKKELDGTKVGTKRFEQLKTEITRNQATIRRFNRELRDTKSLATRVGQGVTNAFKGIAGAFAGAFAAQGVFNFFKNASETIANFEQQLAKVKAVTGATTKEFENLKRSAKELGASSQFTATQVGELQEEFAKLGFSTNEILAATEATLDLATATQSDLGQAATVAASTIRGFGLDAKETQRVTDVMAASFTQSSLDINKFQTAMASVAPVAKSAGVSLEQTTAILGKITDSGVDASTAGTALRNIYLKLAESGMTWDEALNSINTATDKNARALELFGTRGATVATIIANNTTNIEEFTAALEDSTGAASDMADIVGDTLQGDLKALSSAWEGLILSFEEGNNVVRSTTKGLTDIVKSVTTLNEASAVFEEFGFEEDLTGFFGNVNAEALAFFVRAKTINKQLVDNAGNQEALNLLLEDYTRALEINKKSTEENAEARVNLYNKAIESTKLAIEEAIEAEKKAEVERQLLEEQEKARQEQEAARLKKQREKEAKELAKRLKQQADLELEYRRLRAEIRLDGVEEAIELIDIEFDARREKLLQAGLTEQEILFAEEQAKEEIRQQFRDKQLAAEQKKQRELEKTRLAQGEFEEKQKEKAEQRFQAELAMNNARLEAMSSMVGSVISLLSRDEAARKKNAALIKALSISDVIINTQRALANVTTNTSAPTPQNLLSNGIFGLSLQTVQKAAILVQSAGSIATIAAQKFQRGGVLKGASHANGGIPIMAGGGMVEAEGGEAIINKKSTAAFAPILSAINSYGGYGDKFERGGLLGVPSTSPVGDTTNAQLLGALSNINFQPTVSVIEINEAQTRINEVNTSSQL
jgi:hypothetical protein